MFTLALAEKKSNIRPVAEVLFWSIALSLLSRMEIPVVPIPITLQTFGIFLIGLYLTPLRAFLAVWLYLIQVSCGLPILSGGAINAFWFLGAKAGYLISFPFAAALIARKRSISGLILGQLLIMTLGATWLSVYIGYYKAFIYGFLIFIPTGVVKMIAAYATKKGFARAKAFLIG